MIGDLRFVRAHDFLHQTPHPIADDGVSYFFAGRNADAKPFDFRLMKPINDKLVIRKRFPVTVYPGKIGPIPQTQLFLHDKLPNPDDGMDTQDDHTSSIRKPIAR